MSNRACALVILPCLLTALWATVSLAQTNSDASIVLHAVPYDPLHTCTSPEEGGFSCKTGANVQVAPGDTVDIYVYVYAFDELGGATLAFEWDASWVLLAWRGECSDGQVSAQTPSNEFSGLAEAFNCQDDGGLLPLGWMTMIAGASGSHLSVVEHPQNPYGSEVISCDLEGTRVCDVAGSIGSGEGGVDGCELGGAGTTFGDFKGEY